MTKFKKLLKINSLFLALVCACGCLFFTACIGDDGGNGGGNGDNEGPPAVIPEDKVAKNNDYSNPIYPLHNGEKTPVYTADPYVIKGDDGFFYLYCTQTEVFLSDEVMGRTFKRGPVFKSPDCVNWVYTADVFESYTPEWVSPVGSSKRGVWARSVVKGGEYSIIITPFR